MAPFSDGLLCAGESPPRCGRSSRSACVGPTRFCSARSRSAKLPGAPPATVGAAFSGPRCAEVTGPLGSRPCAACCGGPTRRTGAIGVLGCKRAISCRGSGRPPLARMPSSCLSNGAGAGGGAVRATTCRFHEAAGGWRTPRPAPGPNTLSRAGTTLGGVAVGVMWASSLSDKRTRCPATPRPEVKSFC